MCLCSIEQPDLKTNMKILKLILALATGCCATARAGVETYDPTYSSFAAGSYIPVGNTAGWSDSETITSSQIYGSITSLSVNLDISGGFNGALYGYLSYDGVVVTLLDRVGVNSGNSFGYLDSGMNITLSSAAANNIHSYQNYSPTYSGGQLTGTWAPDGNTANPVTGSPGSFSMTPSGTGLNSFNGLSPDGTWTLFLADVISGGSSPEVLSYGLNIVTAVPEPANMALGIFAGLFILGGLWRAMSRKTTG
jgi:hypothetical protein